MRALLFLVVTLSIFTIVYLAFILLYEIEYAGEKHHHRHHAARFCDTEKHCSDSTNTSSLPPCTKYQCVHFSSGHDYYKPDRYTCLVVPTHEECILPIQADTSAAILKVILDNSNCTNEQQLTYDFILQLLNNSGLTPSSLGILNVTCT